MENIEVHEKGGLISRKIQFFVLPDRRDYKRGGLLEALKKPDWCKGWHYGKRAISSTKKTSLSQNQCYTAAEGKYFILIQLPLLNFEFWRILELLGIAIENPGAIACGTSCTSGGNEIMPVFRSKSRKGLSKTCLHGFLHVSTPAFRTVRRTWLMGFQASPWCLAFLWSGLPCVPFVRVPQEHLWQPPPTCQYICSIFAPPNNEYPFSVVIILGVLREWYVPHLKHFQHCW